MEGESLPVTKSILFLLWRPKADQKLPLSRKKDYGSFPEDKVLLAVYHTIIFLARKLKSRKSNLHRQSVTMGWSYGNIARIVELQGDMEAFQSH